MNSIKSIAIVSLLSTLCVPPRPLRLRGEFFKLMITSSPNTRSPVAVACPGIAIATPGLPSIEQIEAELGRIGEEESGTLKL